MPRAIDLYGAAKITHDPTQRIDTAIGKLPPFDIQQIIDGFLTALKDLTGIDLTGIRDFLENLFGAIDWSNLPDAGDVWQFVVSTFIQPIIDIFDKIKDGLNAILGPLFGGVDFGDLPTPAEVWEAVMSAFVVPLNLFANLVGGLLNAAWIPGLDASKIISGLFPISRIGDLQDTLDLLQDGIDSIPGGQALIDKICNALGVSGTGHSVTDVYNALFAIPGGNIGSPIGAINVPGIDASKIISGTIAQSFLNIINIPGSIISGLLSGANIPLLDQSKVNGLGTIASNASTAQGNWASWLSGGSWADISESVADFLGTKETANTADATATTAQSTAQSTITQIFNKLGGNNVPTASQAQAAAAMAAAASTLSQLSASVSSLQNLLHGANGFSASVPFRQPEVTVFNTAGNFTFTLPPWFNPATDSLDVIVVGGGAGGGGGTNPVTSGPGGDSLFKVAGVTKVTGTGGAPVGPGSGFHPKGYSPGSQAYLDILYQGGGEAEVTEVGLAPGGGGGAGNFFGIKGEGGGAGGWGTVTLGPGTVSGALTGTVGSGGAGISGGFGAAAGAPGAVWIVARAAMPTSFTSMGTQILPTWKLNTGVALTDAMTAAATWSRMPPNGASGGYIIKIRSNSAGTNYVYLWVWVVGGVTNYEIGRVSSGTKFAWKTGTIGDAIPFNAFSLTSDNAWTFTASVNGNPFDSYTDGAHSSSMGASYRGGDWASSDSAAPGSIIQFAFLDTGTPARIVSASVATSQGTSSASYTDLATTGPSVTLTVPPSGEIVVDISSWLTTSTNLNVRGYMGFVLSGANTLAASDAQGASGWGVSTGGVVGTIGRRIHLTGLNPGTTTVKAVYKASAATATFYDRNIIVDPKP